MGISQNNDQIEFYDALEDHDYRWHDEKTGNDVFAGLPDVATWLHIYYKVYLCVNTVTIRKCSKVVA